MTGNGVGIQPLTDRPKLKFPCSLKRVPADRRDLRRRLFEVAAGQAGYFTAAQAKSVGYSYQAQAYHVDAGNWERVGRGIFRLTEYVPELHDDLVRWSLWSRHRAVVSHESALAVHGIGEFESSKVHLTVPPRFSMRDPALILHRAVLPSIDVADRVGFRVTTVVRSLVDVAGTVADEEQLARAVGEARDQGVLTLRQLQARAVEVDEHAVTQIERAIRHLVSS